MLWQRLPLKLIFVFHLISAAESGTIFFFLFNGGGSNCESNGGSLCSLVSSAAVACCSFMKLGEGKGVGC